MPAGKILRLYRILDRSSRRAVVVAYDHGLMLGPVPGLDPPDSRLQVFLDGRVNAILVSPGMVRTAVPMLNGHSVGLIVRMDWTNMWRAPELLGFQEGRGCAIASVEDAVRWGADAVLSYLFIGLDDATAEVEEVHRNAQINRACERFGIVHIVEPMARGKRVDRPNRVEYVSLHVRIAGELGADLIKTDFLENESETAQVVATSLVPVLLAGGSKIEDAQALRVVEQSVRAGASGIIFGRNVFQSENPVEFLRTARTVVHRR